MTIIHMHGQSSADDLAREMDRRGAVIERMEADLAWRHPDTAPEDEPLILATTGDHVGEATMLRDEDAHNAPVWRWASGEVVHPNHTPLGWRPMPKFTWAASPGTRP